MFPEHPFAPLHTRDAFLETTALADALRRLSEGLGAREPLLLVTGEPGVGKTELVAEVLARSHARLAVVRLAAPPRTCAELLEALHRRLGAEPPDGASRSRLLAGIESALAAHAREGRTAMIVVDDAHRLAPEVLDELKVVVDLGAPMGCALECLLVGLPALETVLDEPALTPVRQRVSVRVRLEAFSAADTQRYVHHRVTSAGGDGPGLFSRRTCREIAARTRGVPRQIGLLATEAMRLSRAASAPTVEPHHVRTAAANLGPPFDAVRGPAEDAPPAAVAEAVPPAAEDAGAARAAAAEAHRTPPEVVPGAPEARGTTRGAAADALASVPEPPAPVPPAAAIEPTPPAESAAASASQDPSAWVARFIGDRGPIQISSQVFVASGFVREPIQERCEAATAPAEPPAPPSRYPPARRAPARPRRARGWRSAPAIAMTALVAVVAVGVIVRASGRTSARREPVPAAAAPARPSRPAAGEGVDRVVIAGHVDPAPSAPSAPPPAAPTAADSARTGARFSVDVGGYLDLSRALQARDQLSEATGIDAWVVPSTMEGEPRRIVVGIFRTPERAEAAASRFLAAGTAGEATVVPLPPRRARQ